MRRLLFLPGLAQFSDLGLLLLRLLVGGFLMWGTWDNIESSARMREFVAFLAANRFPMPSLLAPVSVYAQFICGALIAAGLLTRWAGLVMVLNFVVAMVMVHWDQSYREQWPAAILVVVSLYFAFRGAGRFSLDRVFT
jgi:putative oxidoreductase